MIVIPMAGMSSRFFKAGYTKPKYMLEAHEETLFAHAVKSFEAYFTTMPFLFIVRDIFETAEFVTSEAKKLGIQTFHVHVLTEETRGQAETVALALNSAEKSHVQYKGPITIFNIDTFRPNFRFPAITETCDGYLEVFQGSGDNWSFAKPAAEKSTKVVQTAEKNPISDLCSTGLYHFSSVDDYLAAYQHYLSQPAEKWEKGELYIAPLYNYLITHGRDIHYNLIERKDVIFCGVPDEYLDFLNRDIAK